MTKRDAYLRRTYGLTEADYERLLLEQNGACALCGKTPEQEGRRLAVEHSHVSGIVRGLACYACNHFLIGRHNDPEKIRRLAEYLERDTGFRAPPKKPKKRKKKRIV